MPSRPILPDHLDLDLAGLCTAAAPLLARLPIADQRIQAEPDARTLRYYQTTGLMDRPIRYDGRVARYGRRHLLQVVAVRLLQSQGQSLAQVQTALAGATDAELLQKLEDAFGFGAPRTAHKAVAQTTSVSAAPSALVAAELAPGLVVTIDSRIHPDPTRVIERLRRALQGEQS